MSENEFNMDNIVNISIDGKALSRELIRGMSDEEVMIFLEEYKTQIAQRAYSAGYNDGYENGINAGYNKARSAII